MNKTLKTIMKIQDRVLKLNRILKVLKINQRFKSNIIPKYKDGLRKNGFYKKVSSFKKTFYKNFLKNYSDVNNFYLSKNNLSSSIKNSMDLLSNLYNNTKLTNTSQTLRNVGLSSYNLIIKRVDNMYKRLESSIPRNNSLGIKKIKKYDINGSILKKDSLNNKSVLEYSNIKTNINLYRPFNNSLKYIKFPYNDNNKFVKKTYQNNSNMKYKDFNLSKNVINRVESISESVTLKDSLIQNKYRFMKVFSEKDNMQISNNNFYISPATEININNNNSTEIFNKIWNEIGKEITVKLNSSSVLPHY